MEGKGRVYTDRLQRGGVGDQDVFEEVPRSEPWPRARHNHTMVALNDDEALLYGGACHGKPQQRKGYFDPTYLDDVWLFSASSCSWRQLKVQGGAAAPVARHCHTLDKVSACQLILFGGFGASSSYLNDLWLLDVDTTEQHCQWTAVPCAPGLSPSIRSQHSSCIFRGKLLIFGGYFWSPKKRKERYYNDLHAFDLERREWHAVDTKGALPHERNRANLVVLRERCLLINGNFYDNSRGSDEWFCDVHELQPNNTWERRVEVDLKCAPRASHMAMARVDARAFFFGGEINSQRMSHLFTFDAE